MSGLPLSCFIIAKNEGDRIARTIRSVSSWVSDIVVVDSGSCDDTVAVAVREGARVIAREWLGFGGQKRFAEEQCRYDWVLNLDADEVVTADLRDAIIALFRGGRPPLAAYGMPICIVYPGQSLPRRWARDNWYIRLYDRNVVRFRDSPVHDTVVIGNHRFGSLDAPIHHFSVRSMSHLRAKLDERMWLAAQHSKVRYRHSQVVRLATEFPMNFLKYYILRRHFSGGAVGL